MTTPPLLMWDTPKRAKTKKEWAEGYGFDGGPTGGYEPNMSQDDRLRWKAKLTGVKTGFPQVEIRKSTTRGSLILLIVNLGGGYSHKQYEPVSRRNTTHSKTDYVQEYGPAAKYGIYSTIEEAEVAYEREAFPTRGINVHISTNGPIQMTFAEMGEMPVVVDEAKAYLEEHHPWTISN